MYVFKACYHCLSEIVLPLSETLLGGRHDATMEAAHELGQSTSLSLSLSLILHVLRT